MCTTKTAIVILSMLTLAFIVILSHYYPLVVSRKRRPHTKPASRVLLLNQTIDNETATPSETLTTLTDAIHTYYDRVEQLQFDVSVTRTMRRRKPAHVSRTSRLGHFQFQYVINSVEKCRSKHQLESPVFLLNYVHSAVGNFARRARIRASWARRSNYPSDRVETVFFVGLPTGDRRLTTQAAVNAESRQFRDIVQVNIVDSYRCR